MANISDADHSDEMDGLSVWKHTFAGMFLAEYHLATGEKWAIKELEEIRDWLMGAQFIDPSGQLRSNREETKNPKHVPRFVGGWGHNPYYEGYGPMCITTSQALMALSLIQRCGVEVDEERLKMAYQFLKDGTNNIGYVWYNSVNAGDDRWADLGRTGSTAIANFLAPIDNRKYQKWGRLNVDCIKEHPKAFPDTHGCPPLGMAWTAIAALRDKKAYRSLMDYHRWWFTLAQCHDETFVSQPNRDAGGSYTSAPRLFMSSVVALIFASKDLKLHMMGSSEENIAINPKDDKRPPKIKLGELRTFRSSDGRTLEARLEFFEPALGIARARQENGKIIDFRFASLSKEDQEYLKQELAKKAKEEKEE